MQRSLAQSYYLPKSHAEVFGTVLLFTDLECRGLWHCLTIYREVTRNGKKSIGILVTCFTVAVVVVVVCFGVNYVPSLEIVFVKVPDVIYLLRSFVLSLTKLTYIPLPLTPPCTSIFLRRPSARTSEIHPVERG